MPSSATAPPLDPTLRTLLLGSQDAGSPLLSLSGHSDILHLIYNIVRQWRWRATLKEAFADDETVLEHVACVSFPKPQSTLLNVNMMPFVLADPATLPEQLHGYLPLIRECQNALAPVGASEICYLTVHESHVSADESQRRPGLHTEGFMKEHAGGTCIETPYWHRWGFGRALRSGVFEGGIFMASTVSDSCRCWDINVPAELVGRGGNVEHLREELTALQPEPAQPRPIGGHNVPGGAPVGSACRTNNYNRERRPHPRHLYPWRQMSLRAGELWWMTDRVPHESVPLKEGVHRQYFRLVTGEIDVWYAAHSTPNPLGTQPAATVVTYDKFTGAEPVMAKEEAQLGGDSMAGGAELGAELALRTSLEAATAAVAID